MYNLQTRVIAAAKVPWRKIMPITHIHTYLVQPRPAEGEIGGAKVRLDGKLFGLLSDVYSKADHQCTIDISFDPAPDGAQQNPARDLVVAYAASPTLGRGRALAHRLSTSHTSRGTPSRAMLDRKVRRRSRSCQPFVFDASMT